jgi:hypothetical protein
MTTVPAVLIQSKTAEAVETTQYTSSNCTTLIDKFTATNVSGATATLTVSLVPNGQVAGATNKQKTVSVLAGQSYQFPEIVGHTLANGDFISTLANAVSTFNIRSSGRQVT